MFFPRSREFSLSFYVCAKYSSPAFSVLFMGLFWMFRLIMALFTSSESSLEFTLMVINSIFHQQINRKTSGVLVNVIMRGNRTQTLVQLSLNPCKLLWLIYVFIVWLSMIYQWWPWSLNGGEDAPNKCVTIRLKPAPLHLLLATLVVVIHPYVNVWCCYRLFH